MELIPAIDLIDGRCVRLTQGDYDDKKVYEQEPVDMAKMYADCGIKRLHVVDLDGAKAKEPCNLRVLERLATETSLDIEWGGGIKSTDALRAAINAGANRVICGSVAVDNAELFASWLQSYGAGHVILGADVRGRNVATHGWLKESEMGASEIIERFRPRGLSQVICTDISKDGMLGGPTFELYERLQAEFPEVEITVSGGIGSMDDIRRLNDMGLRSVIVGKAIYEGKINMKELAEMAF